MRTRGRDHIDRYLKELERALQDLPRARRREIVDEIRSHIAEGQAEAGTGGYGDRRTLVERIGDPDDIAEEARARFGIKPRRRGFVEIAALILLPVGGIVIPILGWFVGVAFLWASEIWTTRDKLIGTLLFPGGLAFPFFAAVLVGETCAETFDDRGRVVTTTCSDPSTFRQALLMGLLALSIIVPIATTAYLGTRLRARRTAD